MVAASRQVGYRDLSERRSGLGVKIGVVLGLYCFDAYYMMSTRLRLRIASATVRGDVAILSDRMAMNGSVLDR